MDMVTLAMAKAYTDSRVGNGAQAEVINLMDYGIDLVELVMSGDKSKIVGSDSFGFWEKVTANRNVEFLVILDETMHFYLSPSSVSFDTESGTAKTVSMTLQTMYQMPDDSMSMITAKIVMVNASIFTRIWSDTEFVPMD